MYKEKLYKFIEFITKNKNTIKLYLSGAINILKGIKDIVEGICNLNNAYAL